MERFVLYSQKLLLQYFGKKNKIIPFFSYVIVFLLSITIGATFFNFGYNAIIDTKFIRNEFINMIKEKAEKFDPKTNFFNLNRKL